MAVIVELYSVTQTGLESYLSLPSDGRPQLKKRRGCHNTMIVTVTIKWHRFNTTTLLLLLKHLSFATKSLFAVLTVMRRQCTRLGMKSVSSLK
jgi:hypothetical protein